MAAGRQETNGGGAGVGQFLKRIDCVDLIFVEPGFVLCTLRILAFGVTCMVWAGLPVFQFWEERRRGHQGVEAC